MVSVKISQGSILALMKSFEQVMRYGKATQLLINYNSSTVYNTSFLNVQQQFFYCNTMYTC